MSNWGQVRWWHECKLCPGTWQSSWKWFSIQCDESMDSSSSLQLMMFIQMVFEELLTQLPLKTTTREADIYNTVKRFFVEEKRDHWKRWCRWQQTGLTSWRADMQASLHYAEGTQSSQNFYISTAWFTSRRCAKVTSFDHLMTPVVKDHKWDLLQSQKTQDVQGAIGGAVSWIWPVTTHRNPIAQQGTSFAAFCLTFGWNQRLHAIQTGRCLAARGHYPHSPPLSAGILRKFSTPSSV